MGNNISGNRQPSGKGRADNVSGREQPIIDVNLGQPAADELKSCNESINKGSDEVYIESKKSGIASVQESSDEYYEYKCDPCKDAGDNAEAEGFCTNCKEYLCSMCFRAHSKSKLLKHHILFGKEDMPRQSPNTPKSPKAHDVDITTSVSKINIAGGMTRGVMTKEEYTYVQDMNVKLDKDGKSFITDITLVSSNELVLCIMNKHCMNLVNIDTNKVTDVYAFNCYPVGITTISPGQIAVVLQYMYEILIVTARGKLTLNRTIKTNGYCLDVQMVNNHLYVSFMAPAKIQILKTTGVIIKTIKPDDDVLKLNITPCIIAVSPDESVIYVSDFKTNKVLSLDMNGNMVALYKGELDHPMGIMISPSGFIYVCSSNQHSVYKMTSDLSEAMVMLGRGDGLMFPAAIYLNAANQRLYISFADNKYRNFLKVFKC